MSGNTYYYNAICCRHIATQRNSFAAQLKLAICLLGVDGEKN